MKGPRLRTGGCSAFSINAGAPVLVLPSRGVRHYGEALVSSIGRNILFVVSANVRVRHEGLPWRAYRRLLLETGLIYTGRQL